MAVPTIATVSPAVGLSNGDELVTIVGTNFRLPTIVASPAQPNTDFLRTVRVLFDGDAASDVRVLDANTITCLAPAHDQTPAPIDVAVINLDDSGNPIAGENVTRAGAYAYSLPVLTQEFETDFTRTIRALMQLMKQKLLVEVNYAVQTDYDPTAGDELHVTKFSKMPGIALVGPELQENRFYSENEEPSFDDGTTDADGPVGFVQTHVPYTVDAIFDVVCATDTKNEFLNLMANFVSFMHGNKFLRVDRSPTDPTLGSVKHELDFFEGGLPKNTTVPNNSNVLGWSARILIRGFDIEAFGGIDAGTTNGVPDHAIVSRGKTATAVNVDPATQSAVSSAPGGPSPGR